MITLLFVKTAKVFQQKRKNFAVELTHKTFFCKHFLPLKYKFLQKYYKSIIPNTEIGIIYTVYIPGCPSLYFKTTLYKGNICYKNGFILIELFEFFQEILRTACSS